MAEETSATAKWPGFPEGRLKLLARQLMSFFRRGGSNASDAEDLTQAVFLRLANQVHARQERSDGYVFTIARNLQRDSQRRGRVRRRDGRPVDADIYPLIHGGGDGLDPERVLISKQDAQQLLEGLAELPARAREILLLYRLEGKSQREIATQLGLSLSAVEKNVARAMLHLAQKLDRDR